MPDVASYAEGGRVLMVSSLDEDHPGDNVIDGSDGSYWLSTGMYPQEILLALAYPCLISAVKLAATCVRAVRIEGCSEGTPVSFKALAELELRDAGGLLQVQELPCDQAPWRVEFLRVVILSGWHDFCSVHAVRVEAEPAEGASGATVELRVRCVGGGNTHMVLANRMWTFAEVKAELEDAVGIQCSEQRLMCGTREVADTELIGLITERSILDLTVLRSVPQRAQWLLQVGNDGLDLRFAGEALQADRELALTAVGHNGDALQFVDEKLKADRGVVLAAVAQKGTAVAWACEALRADREVALAAVRQNGNALQSLAEELRADREVVLVAVKRKGSALRWAAYEIRCDDEVVAAASESFYFTREEIAGLRAAA